jgi:hypothetical protein
MEHLIGSDAWKNDIVLKYLDWVTKHHWGEADD